MKRNTLLVMLMLLSFSSLFAQDDYLKDHVIVYFKDGILNKDLLKNNSHSFSNTDLITVKPLKDSLDKWRVGNMLQKVVRNARPDKAVSMSRTGEEVPVPTFYNLMYVPVPKNLDVIVFCKKLESLSSVIYAEPDYIMKSNNVPAPNDPSFSLQRGWDQGNDRDIDLLRAWDFTRGSNAVRVGVLDGGIDYHNPDLGNGSYGSGFKVAGGYDYIQDDSNPDDNGNGSHGTSVAGIIGAFSNNSTGVAGIAGGDGTVGNMGVQLIALRVSNADGEFPIGKVVEGIYDGATSTSQGGFGCHILNYSAGGYNVYNSVRKAISYAAHNKVVFVAAKGNDNTTNWFYPADYTDNLVIAVGASDGFDQRASFSNYGRYVDFVAPGTGDLLYTTKRVAEGNYGSFNGTSGAAPVVSGIAALMKSVNINLHQDDIERILEISAKDIVSDPNAPSQVLSGYDKYTGYGRVNAGRALELLHAPYVIQQLTVTGGTVGATVGWSAGNPNNNLGYSHIVSQTATTVTFRTYVYYIRYAVGGQTINTWYPASPQNVVFAYTTLINDPYTPTIVGASTICTTNSTFTLSDFPVGATVTWNATPANLFTPSSGTGNVASLRASSTSVFGQGTLTYSITTACSGVPALINKSFWVGRPNLETPIAGPTQLTPGLQAVYSVAPHSSATSYQWIIPSGCYNNYCWSIIIQTNSQMSLAAGNPGGHVIQYKSFNSCGMDSRYLNVNVQNPGGGGSDPCDPLLTASPNPGNGEVTVNVIYPVEPCDEMMSAANTAHEGELIITSIEGTEMHRSTYTGTTISLGSLRLKKGPYLLIYTSAGRTLRTRLLMD